MAGPWEAYQTAPTEGPWTQYASVRQPSASEAERAKWYGMTPEQLAEAGGKPPLKARIGKGIDDFLAAGASGATSALADETAGLLGPGKYDENLAAARRRLESIPWYVRVPGEAVGGTMAALSVAPAMAGTKVAEFAGRLPGWLQSTGLGALFGGAYGAGSAEGGAGERAVGGGIGAATGAATGLATHGLVKGIQAGANTLGSYWRNLTDPKLAAQNKLGQALSRDEMSPARMGARLRDLGPQATVADAGGENVLGLARGATGTPGPAKNRANIVL